MSLQELIEQYIAYHQALGKRFRSIAQMLRYFGRALGPDAAIRAVTAAHVNAFLMGAGPITRYYHEKYGALLGFYRYAQSRGYVDIMPLPVVLPKEAPGLRPYIYSHDELRRLLDATDTDRYHNIRLEPVTIRALVLLLYGTGLRGGEAIALDRADVDLEGSLLTVRHAKFFKSRLVPLGPQLRAVLASYAARLTATPLGLGQQIPFFTTRTGGRVNQVTLEHRFRRLCERVGIRRHDKARYQPRLHDLRHTFAVHRLTSWYREGADVQTLLAHLSVYLGHVHIAATQVYLTMTPELLQEANVRFEGYAFPEDKDD